MFSLDVVPEPNKDILDNVSWIWRGIRV